MSIFQNNWDMVIAFGLIGIIIVVFLISRMGILPKKSLPFLIAALAAVFGIALFKRLRTDKLKDELKKREDELKKKEEKLKELKANYNVSEIKLQEMNADLERHRAAYEKELLDLKAENKKEKDRIDSLSGEELHDEFKKAFGSQ